MLGCLEIGFLLAQGISKHDRTKKLLFLGEFNPPPNNLNFRLIIELIHMGIVENRIKGEISFIYIKLIIRFNEIPNSPLLTISGRKLYRTKCIFSHKNNTYTSPFTNASYHSRNYRIIYFL